MSKTPHDCPGCDRSFTSSKALYGHWSHNPDHRGQATTRTQARTRIGTYLDSVGTQKRRDALGVAIGIAAASMLIHVPAAYYQLLATFQISPNPSSIVPAAAIIRLIQKRTRTTPLTEKQVDEVIFGALVAWLAIEAGHQLAAHLPAAVG